eukprot:164611_1
METKHKTVLLAFIRHHLLNDRSCIIPLEILDLCYLYYAPDEAYTLLRQFAINICHSYQVVKGGDIDEIVQIVNTFHNLLHQHNNNEQLEYIAELLTDCDVAKCNSFERVNKRHQKGNTQHSGLNNDQIARMQIMDKIHCYIKHFQNHQHVSLNRWQKYNQLFLQSTDNFWSNNEHIYCIGYEFKYGYDEEFIYNSSNCIDVSKKYSSLKTELTKNEISKISLSQFTTELKKATIYYASYYCRKTFDQRMFNLGHLLSLMVYCNYTELQYKFSKTYRDGYDNNTYYDFYLLHNHFYNLGENIKICVQNFGTCIKNGVVQSFYHGIDKHLLFPKYIGGIVIHSPLSTSSSLAVASNFTNNNSGLIVQFSGDLCNYFSVSWLSDFTNESEYLFIQNKHGLLIKNIIEVGNGTEYGSIINALETLDRIMSCQYNQDVEENTKQFILFIIRHKLLLYDKDKYLVLNEYSKQIIDTYFRNKRTVDLDYVQMVEFSFLSNFLFHMEMATQFDNFDDFQENDMFTFVRIDSFIILFPNIETITIRRKPGRFVTLDDLINASNDQIENKFLEILQCKEYEHEWRSINLNVYEVWSIEEYDYLMVYLGLESEDYSVQIINTTSQEQSTSDIDVLLSSVSHSMNVNNS